jgi:hypothetical protein
MLEGEMKNRSSVSRAPPDSDGKTSGAAASKRTADQHYEHRVARARAHSARRLLAVGLLLQRRGSRC